MWTVRNKKNNEKRVPFLGVMTALALVLSYIEHLIPIDPGIPGAKLGLANLVTLFTLYAAGPAEALSVGAVRIVLAGLLFGNLTAILYSMAGFLLSFAVMWLLKKTGRFGITAISCTGGAAHNTGQLLAAALLAGPGVLASFPWLFACGTAAGILIGIPGSVLVKRLGNMVDL